METVAKADIFFVVSTLAVIVFLIIGVIIGIYLIGILRDTKRTTARIKHTVQLTSEYFYDIQEKIASFFFGKKKKKRSKH